MACDLQSRNGRKYQTSLQRLTGSSTSHESIMYSLSELSILTSLAKGREGERDREGDRERQRERERY